MLGALPVGHLHLRVIPTRFRDARFEIVNDHPLRHAAQESKGVAVQPQPTRDGLVPNEFDVLMAAPTEGHHEGPVRRD
jgi:hypothetical protein